FLPLFAPLGLCKSMVDNIKAGAHAKYYLNYSLFSVCDSYRPMGNVFSNSSMSAHDCPVQPSFSNGPHRFRLTALMSVEGSRILNAALTIVRVRTVILA